MQNNLMKMEDEFYEENEINIYDLINIFIKNYFNTDRLLSGVKV